MKKIKFNKEKIMSLILAGNIVLCTCGCTKNIKDEDGDYVVVDKNKQNEIIRDTYLYDCNGIAIDKLISTEVCNVVAINNRCALITLQNDKSGYVLLADLKNDYHSVNGSTFVKKGTAIYKDNQLSELAYITDDDSMMRIYYITNSYATVVDGHGQAVYVQPNELDANFIFIDLTHQRMDCYLDYELVGSYPTRSGSNETPTQVGADDIDWKAIDWSFPDYPDSHADYLIVFNENGQAIHNLVGDDEENYGTQAYHNSKYGSHGCVRVSKKASKFVYENYEVGDMVLVRKK